MKLLLVRHGQTQSNVDHMIDTVVPGPPLTELGREQAAALPEALHGHAIDALFVSTQLRAQQTIAPLAAAIRLEAAVRDGLREVTAGDYEGATDTESVQAFVHTELAWVTGDLDRRMPGGETGAETLGRFDAVVREAWETGAATVAMVSHGSMIRTSSGARASNIDVELVTAHPLRNTGVVVLEGSPDDGWTVTSWLDQALPADRLDDRGSAGAEADIRS